MTKARRRWLAGGIAAVALIALGGGLWYASASGRLAPAYAWVRQHLLPGAGAGESGAGGMSMNMPGMEMGSPAGKTSEPQSTVPGLAVVMVTPEFQQRLGVTVGRVEKAPLRMSVRTVGIVRPNEEKLSRVHIRTEGWITRVFVSFTGAEVRKGDPLLSIYSPEFLSAQTDYLNAVRANDEVLAELTRRKFELWDVPADFVPELRRTKKRQTSLMLRSPIAGTVLERNAFEDQYVTPKSDLYVVADLSTVWVQAKVYEYELPHVELGQPATVTLPALPGRTLTGKVVFIQPTVEEPARTVEVRVELPNRDGGLKPGMFAHITIEHHMGEGLLVPTSAILRTGERDVAFRAEGSDHFVPVEVKVGPYQYGDRFHILAGLNAGDRVVTSANFLIDSESRLRYGGAGGMAGMPGMDMGGGKGAEKPATEHHHH
jgi:Cu(I)/Ag(I) efflux system membrane fusion protein